MPITMYAASVPVFLKHLDAMDAILDKAIAYAEAKKIDPAVLTSARLYPDMFPFSRQVQLMTDFPKGAVARLAGETPPSYEDNEKTFPELKARIAKTRDFVKSFKPERIDGSEERPISLKVGPPSNQRELNFPGQVYLLHFVLPNFFFHATAAYAILRANGLEVGKMDFMGA